MRGRAVVLLALVVAALAAFVFLYERRQPSPEERAAAGRKLLDLDADAVRSLAIETPNRPTVRLERQTGAASSSRWRLTEPLARRADAAAVNGLLRALTELDRQRTIENSEPADLGLDTPRFRLTWQTAAGADTLLVGAAVPASGDCLVALASRPGTGFVTPGAIVGELGREVEGWRDHRLFPGERAAIASLRLVAAPTAPPIVLHRNGETYRLAQPIEDLPARDLVEGLLGELTALSAQRFAPVDEPFVASGATVEITFSDATPPFLLELGPPSTDGDGAPVLVRSTSGEDRETAWVITRLPSTVALAPSAWRSRAWTSLASFDIEELDVTGTGAPLTLRRDGVDWRRGVEKISYTDVSDFLAAITAAAGTIDESAGTSHESAGTSLTLALSGPRGARETLVLKGLNATSSARPGVVLQLSADDAEGIRKTLERVRTAKPSEG